MRLSRLSGAVLTGAALLLAGCSGAQNGAQTPAVPSSGLTTQSAQSSAQSAARVAPFTRTGSTHVRSLSSITPGCTQVVTGGYYGTVSVAMVYTKPIKGQTIDGGWCDVALYVPPTVTSAVIDRSVVKNATMIGILAQNANNVNITNSLVEYVGPGYAPGQSSLYGLQEGIDVDYETSSGHLDHNLFINYQKNGTEFYQSRLSFDHNIAVGTYGPPNNQVMPGNYDIIAQNGFEVDYSQITEDHNAAYQNQYNNPTDPVYNRGAAGFLFTGATTHNRPFTCADFTRDSDVAPWYRTDPKYGNDIPFYASPNSTVDGTCPARTGVSGGGDGGGEWGNHD